MDYTGQNIDTNFLRVLSETEYVNAANESGMYAGYNAGSYRSKLANQKGCRRDTRHL